MEFTLKFNSLNDELMVLELYFDSERSYAQSNVGCLYRCHGTTQSLDPILRYLGYYREVNAHCPCYCDLVEPRERDIEFPVAGTTVTYVRISSYYISRLDDCIFMVNQALTFNKYYTCAKLYAVGLPYITHLRLKSVDIDKKSSSNNKTAVGTNETSVLFSTDKKNL